MFAVSSYVASRAEFGFKSHNAGEGDTPVKT